MGVDVRQLCLGAFWLSIRLAGMKFRVRGLPGYAFRRCVAALSLSLAQILTTSR